MTAEINASSIERKESNEKKISMKKEIERRRRKSKINQNYLNEENENSEIEKKI